jgi:hypothetical protein
MKKNHHKMKATEDQIQQWKEKHGTIYELQADGVVCYVYDPASNLIKWKAAVAARRKSLGHLVDCILNNCWLGGDEQFKSDESLKLGIEEQIDEMIDIPEYEIEQLKNGNTLIKVGAVECEVRKATRMDIRYAEDRNKDNRPLDTQIYLLERIAVSALEGIRGNTKVYLSILLAVHEIRDVKHIELKKF